AAVLRRAAAIYCEDTRVTAKLASRFGLSAPRISCHAHNEETRVAEVLARLARGEEVALVSDAGTPAVSDPGERIVAAAAAAGFPVVTVPGPNAAAAALSISGLPAVPHVFLGFPPPKSGARRAFFERYRDRPETLVWFEAPHRLAASLSDAAAALGSRPAIVARELTKIHEEALRGDLSELRDRIASRGAVRGECVVVAGGARAPESSHAPDEVDARIAALEGRGMTSREIAREVARATGVASRDVYRRVVSRK
ncbi:MAG TPA: 16S rRNA (cytidine(1402)-2'-O)-methyltransferase, partial [Thermoanaerobaculia bacterium]|nr:16S rRNA (cytidine(1402)-2'-O)-methyltransferase [Thermoanaerobaculia bacterium]